MAALDSIEVEGYKSIRAATIELGAINVLIGANGAGKSNLLGLFGLLADLADRRLQLHVSLQGGANAILHFGRKRTVALRVTLRAGSHGYEAALVPAAGDTLVFERESPLTWTAPTDNGAHASAAPPGGPSATGHKETVLIDEHGVEPSAHAVLTGMRAWHRFHFHDTGRAAPVKQKRKLAEHRVLRAEGDNVAPFLLALRATATGAYRRIVEAVRTVAPFFDDFVLEPDLLNRSVIQLAWRHRTDDALFTADSLSDGTLRFICLAALLLQPELPSLIVIDEPELGLHPFAIGQLAALVRAAAVKTQVVIATQSVTLLDQFDASEVIVAEQHEGESRFQRLDDRALDGWKQDYSLGELWLKNVLGGRPR
jgi:predicted ATPase